MKTKSTACIISLILRNLDYRDVNVLFYCVVKEGLFTTSMIPTNCSENKECLHSAILLPAQPCNFSCISFDPCAKTCSKHGTTECKRSCSADRYWVEGAERLTKHECERLIALPSLWFHKYHVLCPKNRVIARLRNCPRTLLLWFLL